MFMTLSFKEHTSIPIVLGHSADSDTKVVCTLVTGQSVKNNIGPLIIEIAGHSPQDIQALTDKSTSRSNFLNFGHEPVLALCIPT